MTWNPSLAVKSIEQIIDNLRAEVMSKQVAALAAFSTTTLTPFTKFYRSYVGHFLKDYPHLYVVRVKPTFRQGDYDILVNLQLLIEGEIQVEGPAIEKAEASMSEVISRWGAVDSIIRNISMDALLHGASNVTNADTAQVKVNDWDVIPFEGGPVSPDNKNARFISAPQMTVDIQYYERSLG